MSELRGSYEWVLIVRGIFKYVPQLRLISVRTGQLIKDKILTKVITQYESET